MIIYSLKTLRGRINLRVFEQNFDPKDRLFIICGTVIGGTISLLVIKNLSPTHSALVSALAIASLSLLNTQLSKPRWWWTSLGAIAGIIIGVGLALSEPLAESGLTLNWRTRCTIVSFHGLSGFLSGIIWGRKIHAPRIPTLREFLGRLTGLTVSIFAVVITISYVLYGLEDARTLSSRLSAITTIIVICNIIPSVIGYSLSERQKK